MHEHETQTTIEVTLFIKTSYYINMDEQPIEPTRQSGFRESGRRSSSVQSLGARSSSLPRSSIHNKRSLVQVMSVDGSSLHDDIYEYYLIDDFHHNRIRNNSNTSRMPSSNNDDMDEQPIRRRSSNNRVIAHDCQCDDNNCLQCHCPCYGEPNQMCLLNMCCNNCVKIKNQMLIASRTVKLPQGSRTQKNKCVCKQISQKVGQPIVCTCQYQKGIIGDHSHKSPQTVQKPRNINDKNKNSQICSCKKSHCLKKYCLCFANGRQCSNECQCQDCQNMYQEDQDPQEKNTQRQRYGRVDSEDQDMDIDQYIEDKNYQNQMMPQSMEFEHPDLKDSFRGY